MIKKVIAVATATMIVATLASSVMAATWYSWGSPSFSTTAGWTQDSKRIRFAPISVDGNGRVFVGLQNGNNTTTAGGFGIWTAPFSVTSVDLSSSGLNQTGAITRMVTAGDGKVYALQNWREIGWSYNVGTTNRVLRLNADGTTNVIYTQLDDGGNPTPSDNNQMSGLTVGNDGNVYFTVAAALNSNVTGKNGYLHQYDVIAATDNVINQNVNNGWSDYDRMFNLTSLKGGYMGIVNSGAVNWSLDYMNTSPVASRTVGDGSNPGWGRDHVTAMAYDAVNDRLWVGGRGGSNANIITTWKGAGGSGYDYTDTVFHALGAAGFTTGSANWWVSGLVVDGNGHGWMSFGVNGNTEGLGGYRGHVVSMDGTGGSFADQGVPQAGADVMGLGRGVVAGQDSMFALVVDRTTGQFTLYSTNPVPEPGSLVALGAGLVGFAGLIRRKR